MSVAKPGFVAVSELTPFTAQERYTEDYDTFGDYVLDDGREYVFPRFSGWVNSSATATGTLRMVGHRAKRTAVTTSCAIASGSTAAAATPTLVKFGLYHREADGITYTLVAQTANDTTLFASINTLYTRSWIEPYTKIQGDEYLVGSLIVTPAAAPSFLSPAALTMPASGGLPLLAPPVRAGVIGSLADLPASFLTAGISATGVFFHVIY